MRGIDRHAAHRVDGSVVCHSVCLWLENHGPLYADGPVAVGQQPARLANAACRKGLRPADSCEGQGEQLELPVSCLADQEKECRAYAQREGWPVAGAYTDTMTGFETMDQRPALQDVRELLRTSGADVLLCWRFDRIARDQVDLMVLNREVNTAGARLVSATEGGVENNATGRGMLGIKGMAAEIEREALIARTQGAIRTKAKSMIV